MSTLIMIPTFGFFALAVFYLARPPQRKDVAWFAVQHHLTLTSDNGGTVIDYLRRTRRWRFFGALGAISTFVTVSIINDRLIQNANPFVILFAGWFVGGLLPELSLRRSPDRGLRGAMLGERRPTSYTSLLSRRLIVIALVLFLAALANRVIATMNSEPFPQISLPRTLTLVGLSAVVAAAAMFGIRRIVRRPLPVQAPDRDQAENAIRIASITRVSAGWIVLQFIIDWYLIVGTQPVPPFGIIGAVLAICSFVGVILGWAFVPTRILGPETTGVTHAVPA
jgi:hypothetical protein